MKASQTITKTAISYTRFSSKEQAKGDSYRRQTELAESYCQKNNLTLLDDFFDAGISAFKGINADEGALRELIQRAKDGIYPKGTILIVESLDRISRQEINKALRLFLEILEHGFDIVTLSDGERVYRHDKTELVDLIVSLVVLSRANEESVIKSQRISAAWKQKRKQAKESGKIITSICPAWLKVDNGKFKLIPERVKLLKELFHLSVEKNLGRNAILTILDERKEPVWEHTNTKNKTGRWNTSYIKRLLTNRAVLGEHQPQKKIEGKITKVGEPIMDYYPKVIDTDTFNRAQFVREKRKTLKVGRPSNQIDYNLFKGIIYCSNCGNTLHLINKGNKSAAGKEYIYRYLSCSGSCGAKTIRYDQWEPMALKSIPTVDLRNLDAVNQAIRNRNEAREGQIIVKKGELQSLKERWNKSKSATILELIESTENEIVEIQGQMETEQVKATQFLNERIQALREFMKDKTESWRPMMRDTITRIVKSVKVDTSTLETVIEFVNGDKKECRGTIPKKTV